MTHVTSDPNHKGIFVNLLPGTIGAVLNAYVGHPFDTVRVRMQNVNGFYGSASECFIQTLKAEGIYGIFKGFTSSLCGIMAESSVVFCVNELIKRNLYNSTTKVSLSLHQDMMIGSVSGFVATIAACPFETIKCNIQVNKSSQTSMTDAYCSIKLRGLFSGFSASCFRNIPFYLLFFPFYSRYIGLMSHMSNRNIKNHSITNLAIAGGLSGATTWACVYPMDVIKCNQQIHKTKINIFQMMKTIYLKRGISGFYAGFYPTIFRAFPANAALVFGVEVTNFLLSYEP